MHAHQLSTGSVPATRWYRSRNLYSPGYDGNGSFIADFTTRTLSPNMKFSRAGNGTFINTSGEVEFAGMNVLTNTTNLSLWPTKNNIDTTALSGHSDPFGGTAAIRLTPVNASVAHNIQSDPVLPATLGTGVYSTLSFYAKQATTRYVIVGAIVDNNSAQAAFHLTNGTAHPHVNSPTCSISAIGNGWYYCRMTFKSNTQASVWFSICTDTTNTPSGQTFSAQADDLSGGHGIFITRPMWEHGVKAHPYIFTTSAAVSSIPRFDTNPNDLRTLGLVIEGAGTNLLTYSDNIYQGGWGTSANLSVNYDSGTAGASPQARVNGPDGGTLTATSLNKVSGTTEAITRTIACTASTTYTFSVFVRHSSSSNNNFRMAVLDGAVGLIPTGACNRSTVSITNHVDSVTFANLSNTLWSRCSVTVTTGAAQTAMTLAIYPEYLTGTNIIVYVWGAQVESGARASSYIQTGASTVTRVGDELYASPISPWVGGALKDGTYFICATRYIQSAVAGRLMYFSNNALPTDDNINLHVNTSGVTLSGALGGIASAGVTQSSPSISANTEFRVAAAFKTSDSITSINGVLGPKDSITEVTQNCDQLHIGVAAGASVFFNGHIRYVAFWPVRLPDAQIKDMTRIT